jgi:glycosyltransferase involved in cell wall biosynthesis
VTAARLRLAWIAPTFQLDADDSWSPGLTALAHRVAERCDLVVYALRSRGGRERFQVGRVEVRAFPPGPPAGVRALRRAGPFVRTLAALLGAPARSRPDLVHALWAGEPALAGAIAAGLARRPLILSSMGGEAAALPAVGFGGALTLSGRLFLAAGAKAARVVTAGSTWHAAVLCARLGEGTPIEVMPLGVDLARFGGEGGRRHARPPGAPPVLLAVGSLLPVKGHRLLVEALSLLARRGPPELGGVRLRIVGEGPERGALEALAARHGLVARVELPGEVAHGAMPAEYAAADLFVLSSHYESQCLALVEALACRLPTASTPVGLAPELLGDGRAGELAERPSPEALAAALERLLLRREAWPELGARARDAAAPFALERTTARWLDLYGRVAGA